MSRSDSFSRPFLQWLPTSKSVTGCMRPPAEAPDEDDEDDDDDDDNNDDDDPPCLSPRRYGFICTRDGCTDEAHCYNGT